MTTHFHGTAKRFATSLVAGNINVGVGSGEFGVGFYTQDRVTDAWIWAIARWQTKSDKPAVVQITIDRADLKPLKVKGPLNHKKSEKLRAKARKFGKSAYKEGVDVVIGTIQDRPTKTQEKFESSSAEALLNSNKVVRGLHARP